MALSLGVRKGSKITVGKHEVEVKDIIQSNLIMVSVDQGDDVLISDQKQTEILPDVFVFSGVGASGSGNRLAFKAPREIAIRRV
jgi:hypothetical protein